MSKYQITHICGHIVEHDIVGTNVHGERERRAAQLEKQICGECYRKQQRESAAAATDDLPALTGSDKQIEWATTIRAKAAADLRTLRTAAEAFVAKGDANAIRAVSLIDATMGTASASYWIDNRGIRFDRAWLARQLTK